MSIRIQSVAELLTNEIVLCNAHLQLLYAELGKAHCGTGCGLSSRTYHEMEQTLAELKLKLHDLTKIRAATTRCELTGLAPQLQLLGEYQ